ncbi:MAG: hypothetical protein RI945_198 [Candidatus Parcubacteria bacterium]|jgi:cyclophilin family peptidyl-prolyl cis-trans isomerase
MSDKSKRIVFLFSFLILVIIVFLFFFRNGKQEIESDIDTNPQSTATTSTTLQDINNNQNKNMENQNEEKKYEVATLRTSLGDISIELSKDKPKTIENFIKLAETNFYNNVKFHRVIKGFMIQTGDPLSKDDSQKAYWGTGGPGYKFNDELTGQEKYAVGTVAMANSGPNTNGSQFFIMTSDTPLPPSYTVFGKVVSGIDVAMKIQDVATDASDKPLTPVTIKSVELK